MKSGILKLLETSEPVQACNGTALPLPLNVFYISRQSEHECGKVVCPTHRPHLPPGNIPGTHICYKLSQPNGYSGTFRLVAQCLNQLLLRVYPSFHYYSTLN